MLAPFLFRKLAVRRRWVSQSQLGILAAALGGARWTPRDGQTGQEAGLCLSLSWVSGRRVLCAAAVSGVMTLSQEDKGSGSL